MKSSYTHLESRLQKKTVKKRNLTSLETPNLNYLEVHKRFFEFVMRIETKRCLSNELKFGLSLLRKIMMFMEILFLMNNLWNTAFWIPKNLGLARRCWPNRSNAGKLFCERQCRSAKMQSSWQINNYTSKYADISIEFWLKYILYIMFK